MSEINKKIDIIDSLNIVSSCDDPYTWVKQNNIHESDIAWNTCLDPEWMIFLLSRINFDHSILEDCLCCISMEYLIYDFIIDEARKMFKNQKNIQTSEESKIEINKFINFVHKFNIDINKNILLANVMCARIIYKNYSPIKYISTLADERDMYLGPIKYLKKANVPESEIVEKIKKYISFEMMQNSMIEYKKKAINT